MSKCIRLQTTGACLHPLARATSWPLCFASAALPALRIMLRSPAAVPCSSGQAGLLRRRLPLQRLQGPQRLRSLAVGGCGTGQALRQGALGGPDGAASAPGGGSIGLGWREASGAGRCARAELLRQTSACSCTARRLRKSGWLLSTHVCAQLLAHPLSNVDCSVKQKSGCTCSSSSCTM